MCIIQSKSSFPDRNLKCARRWSAIIDIELTVFIVIILAITLTRTFFLSSFLICINDFRLRETGPFRWRSLPYITVGSSLLIDDARILTWSLSFKRAPVFFFRIFFQGLTVNSPFWSKISSRVCHFLALANDVVTLHRILFPLFPPS